MRSSNNDADPAVDDGILAWTGVLGRPPGATAGAAIDCWSGFGFANCSIAAFLLLQCDRPAGL